MPYGDTESNYNRIGELTQITSNLRGDLMALELSLANFKLEVTAMFDTLKVLAMDIHKQDTTLNDEVKKLQGQMDWVLGKIKSELP